MIRSAVSREICHRGVGSSPGTALARRSAMGDASWFWIALLDMTELSKVVQTDLQIILGREFFDAARVAWHRRLLVVLPRVLPEEGAASKI
jgi:hypothetical protein